MLILKQLKKNDPLKIGGALNANVVYNSQKITGMPPISYFLSGTVNFNFW
ncbi:MAG: hypothetical protein ACJATY_001261, partial [Spirosomataceae bacterium]